MTNILVPTDFSDLSKVAIDFAIKVANKLNGNITLLHVVTLVQPTRASMRLRLQALLEELMKTAQEDMEALVEEKSAALGSSARLQFKIVEGSSFPLVVKSEAKSMKADLIVLGTHGASGMKKMMMGSNAASVIEISPIPVLVIPEEAQFDGFREIVYATDLKHIDEELARLINFASVFGSRVHIFHVAEAGDVVDAQEKIRSAVLRVEYPRIETKVITASEIDKALEEYVEEANGDLLATFTHQHSFYEKLFDKGVTRKLTFHSQLPMLAFRQV